MDHYWIIEQIRRQTTDHHEAHLACIVAALEVQP